MWLVIVFSCNQIIPCVYDMFNSRDDLINFLLEAEILNEAQLIKVFKEQFIKELKECQFVKEIKEYSNDDSEKESNDNSEESSVESELDNCDLDLPVWYKSYEIKNKAYFKGKGVDEHFDTTHHKLCKPYLLVVNKENFTISEITDKLHVF